MKTRSQKDGFLNHVLGCHVHIDNSTSPFRVDEGQQWRIQECREGGNIRQGTVVRKQARYGAVKAVGYMIHDPLIMSSES